MTSRLCADQTSETYGAINAETYPRCPRPSVRVRVHGGPDTAGHTRLHRQLNRMPWADRGKRRVFPLRQWFAGAMWTAGRGTRHVSVRSYWASNGPDDNRRGRSPPLTPPRARLAQIISPAAKGAGPFARAGNGASPERDDMQGAIRSWTITAVAFAGLVACAAPPVSDTAGPQLTPASPATAGQLFAKGCLQQLPRFSGTPGALATEPVTQRRSSGTYYHNAQNLSLKVLQTAEGPYCSVVFGTTGNDSQVINAFGQAASAAAPGVQADLIIDFTPGPDNTTYYNARVNAQ